MQNRGFPYIAFHFIPCYNIRKLRGGFYGKDLIRLSQQDFTIENHTSLCCYMPRFARVPRDLYYQFKRIHPIQKEPEIGLEIHSDFGFSCVTFSQQQYNILRPAPEKAPFFWKPTILQSLQSFLPGGGSENPPVLPRGTASYTGRTAASDTP